MNQSLIDQFQILQNYYRRIGDKGRSIGYTKALTALRSLNRPITSINQIKNVRGIGPKVIDKIQEFLDTGKIRVVEEKKIELQERFQETKEEKIVKELEQVWGIGPARAKKLIQNGITSIAQLRRHQELLTDQQRIGLKYHEDLQKRIPRENIIAIHVILKYYLDKTFGKNTYTLEIAGSYRRGMKDSGDIDCLISTTNFGLEQVVELLRKKNVITDVLSMKNEKFMGIAHCPGNAEGPQYQDHHFRLDIEFVPEESFGTALLYFTGSKNFNVVMRAEAKRKGFLLNEHGIYSIRTGQKVSEAPTELEIFQIIGMNYVPPERR